ncbi:DnaJ domain-containing protein [Artemisia annua]|uniref:DnaJ domain-containing protein n=1 Tax=Artemisia annua TaxID=35608 RepID=A0A2U1QF45_ARTAN|nr:DnaJ domain-containing protein [Artemisia annua]
MSEDINKKTHEDYDDDKSRKIPSYYYHHRTKREEKEMGIWGILIFGLIGATATTLAITRSKSWKGGSGQSYRTSFQEEAWKRYNRRMQEEFEDEMERVERIRRMQSVFNREKNKYNRGYESWKENNNAGSGYHQQFQRNDWYWKTNTAHGNRSNFKEPPRSPVNYALSHHYAILGLSRSRKQPYTDDEIKTAFRSKAKQFHPDQNQDNKAVAEARFKEVMTSYEAIKTERKNMK